MWIPGSWRSPTPNPGEHSDSQALCLPLPPLVLCALLPPRSTQVPRLHAGRLSPAALIKGALYPTLPGDGARVHPARAQPGTARPSIQGLATAGPMPLSCFSTLLCPSLTLSCPSSTSGHGIAKALSQVAPATPGCSVLLTLWVPLSVV